MIEIQQREGQPQELDLTKLKSFIRQTLELNGVSPDIDLSLMLTGDDEIQQLNRKYLGNDAPTDVLSFSMDFDNPESGALYLGDIVISLPAAARQAEAGGHPLMEEVKLLAVHGILHLLGHDHGDQDEKAAMWQLQDQILRALEVQARPSES